MKKFYAFLILLCGFLASPTLAQVTVTATSGTQSATYGTLAAAAAAINGGVHIGTINITLTASTTETSLITIDSSGNATGSSYSSIDIRPAAGVNASINYTGTTVGDFILLNGADGVTFNGIGLTGSSTLTINNGFTGTTAPAIALRNGATNNSLVNCTISARSTALTSGVIVFGVSNNALGNNNNLIQNCDINGNGLSAIGIYSSGTSTNFDLENAYNIIFNNFIHDNFSSGVASTYGIFLASGNTFWTLQGNHIYQTSSRTVTTQGIHYGIVTAPNWTVDAHIIKKNYIGGSAPLAASTAMTYSAATVATGYVGIISQTGGSGTLVDSNVVKNINVTWSLAAGSFGNAGISVYMGFSGTATVSNNEIRDLSFSNTTGAALGSGMVVNGQVTTNGGTSNPSFTISKNTLSNLTFSHGGTGSTQFVGIRLETSSAANLTLATTRSTPTFTVKGNTISNLSAPLAGGTNWVRGIGTVLTQGTSSAAILSAKALIDSNTISQISCNSTLASYTTAAAVGISFSASSNATTNDTVTISNNRIFNLSNTNATDVASSVTGIYSTSGTYRIIGNRIYGLQNNSSGAAAVPMIAGLNVRQSITINSLIANNQIAVGNGVTTGTQVFGILNNFSSAMGWNIYNNSVLVSGTATARNSAALYRGNEAFSAAITTPLNITNNLLVNTRTGGSGIHSAVASYGTAAITSNFNAFISSSAASVGYWNALPTTFANWKTSVSGDAYSVALEASTTSDLSAAAPTVSTADLFEDATPATTGILNIKTSHPAAWIVAGAGQSLTVVNTDFNNNSRSTVAGIATCIGAHQFIPASTPPNASESGTFANGGTTTYTLFNKPLGTIVWNNVGTVSTRSFKFYSGINPSSTSQTYSNGFWKIDVNTDATGYNYDINLNYNLAFIGTATNTADTRLTKTEPGDYRLIANSSVNTTTMVASATGLTNLSSFALTNQANPLPIELVNFKAVKAGTKNNLSWTTASERHNKGFEVLKSKDGITFFPLGFVNSLGKNGKSATNLTYTFSDVQPENGINYYQLRQIDLDGQSELSKIVSVNNVSSKAVSVYPNPAQEAITLVSDADLMNTDVIISNIYGAVVKSIRLTQTQQVIDIQDMAKGVYFVKTAHEVVKIVKK